MRKVLRFKNISFDFRIYSVFNKEEGTLQTPSLFFNWDVRTFPTFTYTDINKVSTVKSEHIWSVDFGATLVLFNTILIITKEKNYE